MPEIKELIEGLDSKYRAQILYSLLKLPENNIVNNDILNQKLKQLIQSTDIFVAVSAIKFIGKSKKEDFVDELVSIIQGNFNDIIKFSALISLLEIDIRNIDLISYDCLLDNNPILFYYFIQQLYIYSGIDEKNIERIRESFKNENYTKFKKIKLAPLWHITHIKNVFNILWKGILCRNKVEENFVSIADEKVLKRRNSHGFDSFDYVPLFFTFDTPMAYIIKEKYKEEMVLLQIDKNVVFSKNIKFTSGNLACKNIELYDDLKDLKKLNWKIIYTMTLQEFIKKNRNKRRRDLLADDDKPQSIEDFKRIKSAEFLVYDNVPQNFIKSIYFNNRCKDYIGDLLNKLSNVLDKEKISVKISFGL